MLDVDWIVGLVEPRGPYKKRQPEMSNRDTTGALDERAREAAEEVAAFDAGLIRVNQNSTCTRQRGKLTFVYCTVHVVNGAAATVVRGA